MMKKYTKMILCLALWITQANALNAHLLPQALPAAATILTAAAWIAHKTNEIYQPHQMSDENFKEIEYARVYKTEGSIHPEKHSRVSSIKNIIIPIDSKNLFSRLQRKYKDEKIWGDHSHGEDAFLYHSCALRSDKHANNRKSYESLYLFNIRCEPFIVNSTYIRVKKMSPHHIPALATYLISMALPKLYPNLQKYQTRGLWTTIGLASLSLAGTGYKSMLNYTGTDEKKES